jgi:hypothetical protein
VLAVDYGPFKDIVAAAGAIMAMVGAIGLAWRGRSRWEPSEQDIPAGAQKVGGLVAGLLIVLLWVEWRNTDHTKALDRLIIALGIGTVILLLVYSYLVGAQSYDVIKTRTTRIIGGFWLKPEARAARDKHKITVQKLLAGSGYDPDKLWSRPSRQLAKSAFQLCYLGLTICGTVALAAAAIRVGLATG